MKETGLSLAELAERLDYKSLKRAMAGEIPLPESKRRHIQDLIQLARYWNPKTGGTDSAEITSETPSKYRVAGVTTSELKILLSCVIGKADQNDLLKHMQRLINLRLSDELKTPALQAITEIMGEKRAQEQAEWERKNASRKR